MRISQSATGKSDVVRSGVAGVDIFQSATGKSLPRVLCLTSFTNLVLIANYCQSPQELLFYIVYAHLERLKAKELPHAFESDAYRSLLGGDKKNYSKNARVTVTEYVDRLVLENRGSFYDGKPEDYILGEHSPSSYRNPQLVKAMRELNMIDTMGYGIHQMYADQKKRYLPLHDYDLTEQSVRMTIYGHVVDEAYSSLLVKRPDLSLEDVCLLDRIQKHLAVTAAAVAHLRREGLIEGRMPHPHISAVVAEATGQQAEYMRKKELPGSRYRAMLIDYIGKFNGLTRKQINDYMIPEIRGELSIEEKTRKITNLLTYLRQKCEIKNIGTDRKPLWVLTDSNVNSNVNVRENVREIVRTKP